MDPEGSLWAARRAAHVIHELGGGTILSGHLDAYQVPISRPPVTVRPARMNRLLGLSLTTKQMASYLDRLGVSCEIGNGPDQSISATPPSWRWDLEREVDVAEEVARVHGFQNVPVSMPAYVSAPDKTRENHHWLRRVPDLMNSGGFTEIVTMSFVSADAAREFVPETGGATGLPLMNPLTEDYAVMRTSLVPGLLAAMKRNVSFRCADLKLYEMGKTFTPLDGQELPREDLRLGGLATGARYPALWNVAREEMVDFYDVKGALENVLEGLGVADVTFEPSRVSFLHPGKSADLILEGQNIGYVGELVPYKTRNTIWPETLIFSRFSWSLCSFEAARRLFSGRFLATPI